MLDVRRLRVLKEVWAAGSVTRAATNLGYTHSAVSQHLHALERETGTQLIERNGRTIRLTHAAEVLVVHARTVLAHLERAEADLAATRGEIAGEVRLATFATAMRALLPEPLLALRTDYPDLDVRVLDMEPEESLPALAQRRADIAVAYSYDLVALDHPVDLHEIDLYSEPILLVRAAAGDAADSIRLADYADARWILPPPESACGLLIERACAAAGFIPRGVAWTRDFTAASALAAAGVGVTLIPQLGLQGDRNATANPVTEPRLRRRLYLATRQGNETHPHIAAVLTSIQTHASHAR